MRFVDTNVFLRAIATGNPVQTAACGGLLERVEAGEEEITTCEAVICEVVYVLSSRGSYGLSHEDVRNRFAPVLRLRGLRLPGKHLYLEALDLYADHPSLDFEDVLCVVHAKHLGLTDLLSYDRDFDRVPGVRRVEP